MDKFCFVFVLVGLSVLVVAILIFLYTAVEVQATHHRPDMVEHNPFVGPAEYRNRFTGMQFRRKGDLKGGWKKR